MNYSICLKESSINNKSKRNLNDVFFFFADKCCYQFYKYIHEYKE